MAEIITTHSLLMNDILYNIGDVIPAVKYVDEAGEDWELCGAEITNITEEHVEFASKGSTYVVQECKIQ